MPARSTRSGEPEGADPRADRRSAVGSLSVAVEDYLKAIHELDARGEYVQVADDPHRDGTLHLHTTLGPRTIPDDAASRIPVIPG